MSPEKKTHPRLRAVGRTLLVFILAFDAAFLFQRWSGAYQSEFGGHPDEAAHYVTGLFVRDAISTLPECAAKRSTAPLTPYVRKDAPGGFYEHYPKVALGVWPPAFYLVQSAWTFAFGASRTSVLLLMAALAAGVATLIHGVVRREFGNWPAVAAALLWLCLPEIRDSYGMLMAETLSTLTMFAATLCWGRWLDGGKRGNAIAFGILAAVAILTKGTGLALVLMCGFSLLLSRRWEVLRRPATWVGAAIVALLAGPWTWYFRNEGTRVGGWADNSGALSWNFTKDAMPYYALKLVFIAGYAIALFAIVGAVLRLFKNTESRGLWASILAMILGVWLFQSIVPAGFESRHLLSTAPAMVLLAVGGALGLARISSKAETVPQRQQALWLVLLALLVLPHAISTVVRKEYSGFTTIAEEILSRAEPGVRVLVSSDAAGEGMLISELAMRDQRPNLYIERASQSLVDPKSRTWDGSKTKERFTDDEALLAYLTTGKIEYIVLDDAVPDEHRKGYHDQLRRVMEDHIGATFWAVTESQVTRDGVWMVHPVKLYRIRGK